MSKAKLYQKIAKVMGKVERIPKRGRNSFHNYDYVTESDLVDSARKLMVEEGLVLFNNVKEYEIDGDLATVTMEFTLCDTETGESITSVFVSQGSDKTDKAFYKAYAGGTKYFLMKTFLIPTGDDPEADATTDQRAYGQKQSGSKQTSRNQNTSKPTGKMITDKQKGFIKSQIDTFAELVNQDEEAVIQSLRERIGNFESIDNMTMTQATHAIDRLKKWNATYQDQQ